MNAEVEQKQCKQCTKTKPLSAFHKRMHHCIECYQENRERQWRELAEAQEAERKAKRLIEKEAKHKEFQVKAEEWYVSQPDSVCPRCKIKRTAREFGFWGEDFPEWVWDEDRSPSSLSERRRRCPPVSNGRLYA